MAIRITGMYSGLDTESIISELVSAQSVKKSKYVKEQTKLSWKMDAWKALNTKIFNFYTNTLDNMRFQASFMRKSAKVSNSNILSATATSSAVNGFQEVNVLELAKSGKLTGRDLSLDNDGKNIKGTTKLSELGIKGDASFNVTVGSKTTKIDINGDMTINDVVSKLQSAGINANYDATNHRFFLSSKTSGAAADFTISANNEAGLDALESLGLLTSFAEAGKNDPIRDEYQKWADYQDDPAGLAKAVEAEVQKRANALKKANDELQKKNETLQEQIDKIKKDAEDDERYTGIDGDDAGDLYEELYGPETVKKDENGDDVVDADGNQVMERVGGLKKDLDDAKAALAAAEKERDEYIANADADLTKVEELNQAVEEKRKAATDAQAVYNEKYSQYSYANAIKTREDQIAANKAQMEANEKYFEPAKDDDGNETGGVVGTDALKEQVEKEFNEKVELADRIINGDLYAGRKMGDKVVGQDAVIEVDGATFTSKSNDFNINGMNITVYEQGSATITTGDDVDGIYDMVKNFLTEYNNLINEMSALYNADSSKGYDPLTSEEKDAMSDSEIEEWEKKIKDSLLRRDSTLGDISDTLKNIMLQGATVNGKKMYLSDFGINTLGYFNAADNEKSAYHIDGDPDDASVKDQDDKLRAMIARDPDTVMNFFNGLSKNLYETLTDKMKSVQDTSSAFTVYNDKLMQKEYDNYKDKIAKEETKLNNLMDKWYEKFSRMETAMAKLQSKSGGLSSMLGGN